MIGIDDQTVWKMVRDADERQPQEQPDTLAVAIVKRIRAAARDELLARAIADLVVSVRRSKVRALEQEAVLEKSRQDFAGRVAEWEEQKRQRQASWVAHPASAPRNTRVYKTWATTTDEGRVFEEQRAREEADKAERARLYREDPDAYDERYGVGRIMREFQASIEAIRTEAKLELTSELLGASFALGDGRSVTWGSATMDEHRQRIEMLGRNIEGNLDTMRVHEMAVELLRRSGADCLNLMQATAA